VSVAVLGFTCWGGHNCSWRGADLYCHSEPPLTSRKLCFIINFIAGGGATGEPEFLSGAPFEPPLVRVFVWLMFICYFLLYLFLLPSLTYRFMKTCEAGLVLSVTHTKSNRDQIPCVCMTTSPKLLDRFA